MLVKRNRAENAVGRPEFIAGYMVHVEAVVEVLEFPKAYR
jgi:hypothetical protein